MAKKAATARNTRAAGRRHPLASVALILIGLFAYHPVLTGMFFSFFDRNPCFTSTFLGLGDE